MAKITPSATVVIGLNAVLVAVKEARPLVLCIKRGDDWALPYGRFNPARHRTFEIGLRDLVEQQTRLSLGFVEQLYTFGDKGRESPSAVIAEGGHDDRIISVGYLGLIPSPQAPSEPKAAWRNWYEFFPYEDWIGHDPRAACAAFLPPLQKWAKGGESPANITERMGRVQRAFGLAHNRWEEERCLQRYELLYEAGLVQESWRDSGKRPPTQIEGLLGLTGRSMASDHRRIVATAIGRLRGKLRYRPVIFDLMAGEFTLLELQRTVEAIIGFPLHKQNFRRGIENSGLVEKTDRVANAGSGRPAALFTLNRSATEREDFRDRSIQGLTLPRWRGE